MAEWVVASETSVLTDVLLCAPEHYRWLPTNAIARRTLAESRQPPTSAQIAAQHGELVAALEQSGVGLHWLRPAPHLPYMVYTRDQSVVTPWGAVLCQLERPQRRGEYAALIEFHEHGFWHMASDGTLEGGDIHIIRPGLAVIGASGGRTDEAGAEQFSAWLRAEGWEVRVEIFDEHFLHLDVLFCMAADGLAVACLDVLDPAFVAWLAAHGIRCIDVQYREAMALGCNILALGDGRVISARESGRLNAALRAEGLTVLDPMLGLFAQGGGGPHCLTGPLRRLERTSA
jgi:arginine deiminase